MQSLADIELEAHSAWDNGRRARALQLFQRGADAGLVGCMLDLGFFYDVGIGTRTDKAMAMRWYKRAYRRGDAAAASNIAVLYKEQGKSRLAFGWYAVLLLLGTAIRPWSSPDCICPGKVSVAPSRMQRRIFGSLCPPGLSPRHLGKRPNRSCVSFNPGRASWGQSTFARKLLPCCERGLTIHHGRRLIAYCNRSGDWSDYAQRLGLFAFQYDSSAKETS